MRSVFRLGQLGQSLHVWMLQSQKHRHRRHLLADLLRLVTPESRGMQRRLSVSLLSLIRVNRFVFIQMTLFCIQIGGYFCLVTLNIYLLPSLHYFRCTCILKLDRILVLVVLALWIILNIRVDFMIFYGNSITYLSWSEWCLFVELLYVIGYQYLHLPALMLFVMWAIMALFGKLLTSECKISWCVSLHVYKIEISGEKTNLRLIWELLVYLWLLNSHARLA